MPTCTVDGRGGRGMAVLQFTEIWKQQGGWRPGMIGKTECSTVAATLLH